MRSCMERPVVLSEKCQRFLSRNYHLHKGHSYRFGKSGRASYIHRDVWEYFSGEQVPDGFVIHHEDGDRSNNQYENLICISSDDHSEHHTWRRMQDTPDEVWREWQALSLERSLAGKARMSPEAVASMKAKQSAWHKSPDGVAFHKRHYEENLKEKLTAGVAHRCAICGVEFVGNVMAKYCPVCRVKDVRKGRKRSRSCKACGVGFQGYKKRVYCSDECKAAFKSLGHSPKGGVV